MIGIFAALSAALAVGAGAFGAHGAYNAEAAEWLKIGGIYQLVHAVAALAIMHVARGPAVLLLTGGAIFALTLDAMARGGPLLRWRPRAGWHIRKYSPVSIRRRSSGSSTPSMWAARWSAVERTDSSNSASSSSYLPAKYW